MLKLAALACAALVGAGAALASPTLDRVRAVNTLSCGVITTPEDWNKIDLHGPLGPLGVEICKAVTVAALGPEGRLAVRAYAAEPDAEEALHKSAVDLIVGVTPSASAMWHWTIAFGPPVLYDGQGFLVRKDAQVKSLAMLAGMRVCVIEGTDNEKILLARTRASGIAIIPLPFQEEGEMEDGFAVRHCDAISAYLSKLAQAQKAYPKQLGDDVTLPDLLTLSPVAPAYRQGDEQWGMMIDWTIHALVQAGASGVTAASLADKLTSEDPVVQRLLGVDWAASRALGLNRHDWAAQVIAILGNYGEIYDRTVGLKSALGMPRGLNALWREGGLMHPLPVQ